MTFKEYGIKRVFKLKHRHKCVINTTRIILQKDMLVLVAILTSVILIYSSYNYVHHLVYKHDTQIIEIEKYIDKYSNNYHIDIQDGNIKF